MPNDPTLSALRAKQVGAKAERKLLARRDGALGVWSGLGMMGSIGWSVVVPTLAGAALGLWLDSRHPGAHPWSLALLMAGLVLGCLNAWRWVAQQDRAIHDAIHDADREAERTALIREYLFISLFRACAKSLASENASRLAAMARADRNILDRLEQLHGRFYRQRQGLIDEELFDVITGYEAACHP